MMVEVSESMMESVMTIQRRPRRTPEEIAAAREEKAHKAAQRKKERRNRVRREKAAKQRQEADRARAREEREAAKIRKAEIAAAAAIQVERERREQLDRIKEGLDALPRRRRLELDRQAAEIRKARRATATAEARPQRRRIKTEKATILGPDSVIKEVAVQAESAWSMRGLEQHQRSAADRFERDWRTAYPGLRSSSIEPGVDGGSAGSSDKHVRAIDAQRRLASLRLVIGDEMKLLEAVIVFGAGPASLHQAGGGPIAAITERIKRALDAVSCFYEGRTMAPDKTLKAAMLKIEAAGRAA